MWQGFVDPYTNTATFSISIAQQNSLASSGLNAGSTLSNITIGSANNAAYVNSSFINITANTDFAYSYPLNYMGFGTVYYNGINGSASS